MFVQYVQACFEILPTFNKKKWANVFSNFEPPQKKMYEISFELIFKIHTFNIEVLKKVDRGEYLLIYLINKISGSFREDLICN